MTRQRTIDGLKACYGSLKELGASLTPDQWAKQSLCPDWDMTGIIHHLAILEAALVDFGDEHPQGFADLGGMGEYAERWASTPGPEMFEIFLGAVDARSTQLDAMSDEVYEADSWTPLGPGTYGRFMGVRVFDFWIHEQDMRVPLGLPGHLEGVAAEIALDSFVGAAGFVMGKGVGLADGQSVAVHVTGDAGRDVFVAANGRAAVVETLDNPTVDFTIDHQALMLLGAGRVDPQEILDAGRIEITGDSGLGDRVARNLRFVTF